MRRLLCGASLLAALAVACLGGSAARASDAQDTLLTHEDIYGLPVPATNPSDQAEVGPGNGVGPGQQGKQDTYCGAFGEAGRGVFDKDISCDDPFSPDNEISVAVDAANPNLVMAGSNDYQINFNGNSTNEQIPSGFMLSQDSGGTWIDGSLPMKGSLGGGDPVPQFNDKYHLGVFASLSFVVGQGVLHGGSNPTSRGNVEFASFDLSKLGPDPSTQEITWSDQTVANGSASDNGAQQIFLDKEWLAVDNNPTSPGYGNMYITYTQFRFESGVYDESPIMLTMSTDGGKSWSDPVEISGRNPVYCTYQADANDPNTDNSSTGSPNATAETADDPNACDEDQFSSPSVAPDGTLYVGFQNEQNQLAWEKPQMFDDQVMIVKGILSANGKSMTFQGEAPTAANQAGCVRVPQQAPGTPAPGFSNPCVVPVHIANLEDSNDNTSHVEGGPSAVSDYPINVNGSTTLTGHQFRMNSYSDTVVAPAAGAYGGTAAQRANYRVYSVFDDNAAGIIPGFSTTPGVLPITNINVYYAYSDDKASTWVGGDQALGPATQCVTGACPELATRLMVQAADPTNSPFDVQCGTCQDEFYPWADANPATGAVAIGFMDGSQGVPRNDYGFSVTSSGPLVTGTPPVFGPTQLVSTQPSHPNQSRFFRPGFVASPACGDCATFIGDYNRLAFGKDGNIHTVWTQLQRPLAIVNRPAGCTPPACTPTPLFGEDAFYARIPPPTP
jgi:hypothetical protein